MIPTSAKCKKHKPIKTISSVQDLHYRKYSKAISNKIKLNAGEACWDLLDKHRFISKTIPAGVDLMEYSGIAGDTPAIRFIRGAAQKFLIGLNHNFICNILTLGDFVRLDLNANESESTHFIVALGIATGVDFLFNSMEFEGNDGTPKFERVSPEKYLASLALLNAYKSSIECNPAMKEFLLMAAGYSLGQAGTFCDNSKFMLFIHGPEFRKNRASKAAKVKSINSDSSKDKRFVRGLYIDWKMGKSTFKSTAAFIRFSLDRCNYVENTKTLERWVREWKKENENGALLAMS